jgi:hypothetical protein
MRVFRSLARSHGWRLAAAVAVLLVGLVGCAAQPRNNFEGVWKLDPPRAAFKPSDLTQIPFTPQGRTAYEQNKSAADKGDYSFDPTQMRCSSPGLPRLMLTPKLIKIYQRPHQVAILFEWNRLLRQIVTDDGPKLKNPMQEGMATGGGDVGTAKGMTTGHWDGQTLVAHSTKFSEQKLLDKFIPNSEDLQITERIRLKNAHTLEDRITIVDPEYFTQPWDTVLTYTRQSDKLYPFAEDVCLDRKKAGELPLPR